MRPQQKTGRSAQYLLSSSARIYGTRSWGRYSGSLATPQKGTIQQASEETGGKGTEQRKVRKEQRQNGFPGFTWTETGEKIYKAFKMIEPIMQEQQLQ